MGNKKDEIFYSSFCQNIMQSQDFVRRFICAVPFCCEDNIICFDDRGTTEIYTVKTPSGEEVLFPAIAEFVVRVDVDAAVFVRPIPGFFEEDGDEV